MWRRFTELAETLERQVATIASARLNPSNAAQAMATSPLFWNTADNLGACVCEIAESKADPTATKLKKLEK